MFTLNWYYGFAKRFSSGITFTVSDFPKLRTLEGATPSSVNNMESWSLIYANSGAYYMPEIDDLRSSLSGYGGAIIGTGTTPPAIDDYNLSGDMITTFSASSAVSRAIDDSGHTITVVYTITNTGTADFTIGEIGLIAGTNTSAAANKCLLERTVLDTPVTIAAGGVGQVTYTIRMNYPT